MATARYAKAVTPHATNEITPNPDFLHVGGAGTVVCRPEGAGTDVTFTVPAGGYVFCKVSHVRATSTATLIVGLNY